MKVSRINEETLIDQAESFLKEKINNEIAEYNLTVSDDLTLEDIPDGSYNRFSLSDRFCNYKHTLLLSCAINLDESSLGYSSTNFTVQISFITTENIKTENTARKLIRYRELVKSLLERNSNRLTPYRTQLYVSQLSPETFLSENGEEFLASAVRYTITSD